MQSTALSKAKVERAVQIVQRWILARLRNEKFFSLDALNIRIAELLEDVNARKMRVYGASRNELFERIEKGALLPLPQDRFVYAEWKTVRVNRLDYHVEFEGHYYSAPHGMAGEEVEARATALTVELFHRGERLLQFEPVLFPRLLTPLADGVANLHVRWLLVQVEVGRCEAV